MSDIREFASTGFSLNGPADAPAAIESAPTPAVETPALIETAPVMETPVFTAPIVETPAVIEATPTLGAETPVAAAPVVVATVAAPAPLTYADPFIEQLNAVAAAGGDIKAYLATQLVDYDVVPAATLAREALQRQYPAATPAQIEVAFARKYTTDPEQYDTDDVAMGQMQLDADAAGERTMRKAEQAKLALPAARVSAETSAADSAEWRAQAAPVLSALTTFSIGVEGLAAPLAIPITQRGYESQVLAPETMYGRWMSADGKPNTAAMASDLAYLDNRATIHQEIFNAGKRAVLSAGAASTPTGGEPVAALPAGSGKSEQELMFEGMRAARVARGILN